MRKTIATLALLAALSVSLFFLNPGEKKEAEPQKKESAPPKEEPVATLNPLLALTVQDLEPKFLEILNKSLTQWMQRIEPALLLIESAEGRTEALGVALKAQRRIVISGSRFKREKATARAGEAGFPLNWSGEKQGVRIWELDPAAEGQFPGLANPAETFQPGEIILLCFWDSSLKSVQTAFSVVTGKAPGKLVFQTVPGVKRALLFNIRGELAAVQTDDPARGDSPFSFAVPIWEISENF